MNNRIHLKIVCGLASIALVWSAVSVHAQTIAYKDITIETMGEQGRLENATLLIKDGKVAEVGIDILIPEEARIVSMDGATIMPGIIDAYFVFKRAPQAQTNETVTFNGRTFTIPSSRTFSVGSFDTVSEYFYPYQFDFLPSLRSGITAANLVSDGRGLSAFAHFSTIANSAGAENKISNESNDESGMLFQEKGLLFAKVTNQTSALDVIRKGLAPTSSATASRSRGTRTSTNATASRARGNGNSSNGGNGATAASSNANDESKALWTEVREGKKPLVVNVNNAATVAHVLKILDDHDKVKLCLVSTGPNVFESLDEIKKKKVSLVIEAGIDTVPFTTNRMNVAKMIAEREIPFALSPSLNQSQMQATLDDPLFPISVLVKTGLSRDAALQALTISPARLLGIEESHGSIEKGKVANLLVFDGDPLATNSRLRQVIVEGKLIHEN